MQTKTIDDPVAAELAEAARREPVTVVTAGKPAFVAIAPDEFERLMRFKWSTDAGRDPLLAIMDQMAKTARERGLTDEELERLLADES